MEKGQRDILVEVSGKADNEWERYEFLRTEISSGVEILPLAMPP